MWAFLCGVSLLWSGLVWGAPPEARTQAAEYYFSQREYKQSLQLWEAILKDYPSHEPAIVRISQLKLLFFGREVSQKSILDFLQTNRVSPESKKKLRKHLSKLQSLFLTEAGQTSYLKGIALQKRGDHASALGFFEKAENWEKGNTEIIAKKAATEKRLGMWESYYQSLKSYNDRDPFNDRLGLDLSKAHLFFQQPEEVIAQYNEVRDFLKTDSHALNYGLALIELERNKQALPYLKFAYKSRDSKSHPILYYALGKALFKDPDSKKEAQKYLNRFIKLTKNKKNYLEKDWDPYLCELRRQEAAKLVQSEKSKSKA